MATYNTKPKPRALFIDFDDELAESNLSALFPTHKSITALQLDSVRVAEYDVVIVAEADRPLRFTLEPHLIFVGGTHFSQFWQDEHEYAHEMLAYDGSVATEFIIEDDLDDNLTGLAKDSLLPILRDSSRNPILVGMRAPRRTMENLWRPLIKDADDNVLVGYVQRHPLHSAEQWYLPPDMDSKGLEKCIKVLMQRWAMVDPSTFSLTGDWRESPTWQSSDEQGLQAQISSAEEDFKRLAADHAQNISELRAGFKKEQAKADTDHRLLLTSQGVTLKDKIADVLSSLGFQVTNVDDIAKKGDLLEDLRVTTTHEGKQWIALVEVRGYKRGAQLSDLLRISGRFIKRYMQESSGATPDAAWYIVNHDIDVAPDQRQGALSGNRKEVRTFGEEDNGLVIDTTALFQLRNAVESGALTVEDARASLIKQSGFYELPQVKKK